MAKCDIRSLPEMDVARDRTTKFKFEYEHIEPSDALCKYAQGKKYFLRTYGCQANYRDEEIIAGLLEKAGYSKAEDLEHADFVLLNTCAVRENAEDKVYGMIGDLKGLKSKNKGVIIALCGCMVQQKHIIENVLDKYKHVDLIFGTHNIHQFLDLLDEVVTRKVRVVDVKSLPEAIHENMPSIRRSTYKAFINISYGCDKFCTYCIVPYTRGKERSRKMDDILKEVQELKDLGYKEVTLLGENVNAYGKDLPEGQSFARLLEETAKIGIPRVRFLTSHPWDFTDDIIETVAKYDNIMKYIHLPVQAGNAEILRLMGRRYTPEQYKVLVDKIRKTIPGVALSTDIIVGFPNETYEQFLDTVEMVKYAKYESAFTFIYSPRNGTPAAKMKDDVSPKEKSLRFRELVKELEVSISESSNKMVRNPYDVLVEGPSEKDPTMMSGYTETNKLVHFKGDVSLVGEIVKVKITASHTYSLIGDLVNER